MASLCKRQQCTIDRRGFRQELDSWRHKLIHCVGFESILDGLFGPELIQDLQLYKDREPHAVSDWSFDENCVFCCLRRNKVKEHLSSLNSEGLEDPPKPLLVKDQTLMIKLERQAEEFLSAVLRKKDVPNFSDSHVPVVAREILQGMIRQFAAEYTSKSSPQPQEPHSDQSLPCAQPASPLSSTHSLNPVLSKLLMIDQDAPLDLTIKKPTAEPTVQDGVLDLSIKKNRPSSCLSPFTPTPKGEPREVQISKFKGLQAVSTLEQFITKLCLHHQRQIINTISFLKAEVKSLKSSKPVKSAHEQLPIQMSYSPPVASPLLTSSRPSSELPKPYPSPDIRPNTSSCPKLSLNPAVPVAASRTAPSPSHTLPTPATPTTETKTNVHGDHGPLKLKIMKTGSVAAGNKLSCVITTSLSPKPLDEKQGNTSTTEGIRLGSSFKKHNESSHPDRQTVGHAEDGNAKPFSFHSTIPSRPRTARKSIQPSTERYHNDLNDRVILDPDLGHCDIVYINKPITECFKKRHRGLTPRRNARKSTRGLMYADEIWELKTVRTLAGRGNCPNPLLEFNTSVTPKQNLFRPEGVPPVDMPCAGECREAMDQQIVIQEPTDSELSEMGHAKDTATGDGDVVVETSQTDQSQVVEETICPSPSEQLHDIDNSIEQASSADLEQLSENKDVSPQITKEDDLVQPVLPETVLDSVESSVVEQSKDKDSSDITENPLPESELLEKSEKGQTGDALDQESLAETVAAEISTKTQEGCTDVQQEEKATVKRETKVEEKPKTTVGEKGGEESTVFSKTLEELSKELPPWRRRKSSIRSAPKAIEKTEEMIVGYVSGKPVSVSDRSLRRKSGQTQPPKEMGKSKLQKVQNKIAGNLDIQSSDIEKALPVEQEPAEMDSAPCATSQKEEPSDKPSPQPSLNKSKKAEDRKKAVEQNSSSKRHLRSSGQILVKSPSIPPLPVTTSRSKPSTTESKDSSPPLSKTLEQTPPQATEEPIPSETNVEPKSDCSISATAIPVLTLSPTSEQTPPQATEEAIPEEAIPSETSIEPKSDSSISATSIPALTLSPTSEQAPSQATEEVTPSGTSVESNLDEHLSEQTDGQSKEPKSPVMSKPKLRSAKTEAEESKGEKVESVQKENPVKDEPRAMSLRSKRSLQLEPEPSKSSARSKPNEVQVESSSSADSTGPVNKKPARMPLRSEANKVDQAPPTEEKRPLRSQRSSSAAHKLSEEPSLIRMTKTLAEPTPQRSSKSGASSKSEPIRSPSVKFLNALNGAKNQQLISNLNLKFDKMHKGWMQLDREGQPAPKHKNKADRQAAIWKSKRRVRKPKLLENQKYSPVQMLFMKGYDLDTICRWFIETTETKSLVIVKKVNTRLPSETQLCFHSSGASGSAQGVYPSLQAERLKKHLKKFAIASPVKSNPKTQKLIAKVLEQELISVVKGKEKREVVSAVVKKIALSSKSEPQKAKGGKAQNPASARILRKYSNIREKQATARLKEKAKVNANLKSLTKEASKNSNLKALKSTPVKKQLDVEPKSDKKKVVVEKANVEKSMKPAKKDKAVKSVKASCEKQEVKDEVKKELPKRTSKRLGPPPPEQTVAATPKDQTDKNVEEKKPVETSRPPKTKAVKVQKEPPVGSESQHSDNPDANSDGKVPSSPDQVQTRSQRRVDSASPVPATPKSVTKRSGKGNRTPPAEKPALTRSSALKLSGKRSQTAVLPRSASKKAQEALETPAKRTRSK